MVNLFEQWNDMDFASTYEPIDWKALNDFANRARQDAKDNADLLKEKMKEFDTIYKDPNSEKVAAKVAKLNEVRSQVQNIDLNNSPAMVSAQLSKYRNPLVMDAENFNIPGKARGEQVAAIGMTEQELQRVDNKYSKNLEDNSTTFQPYVDYQTNLNAAKQRLNEDKAASSFNGNTKELAAITQSKVMTFAVNDDSNLKIGKQQEVDHGLASIGVYGKKSKWWDRYKNYIELDGNGNPVLDENGMAIVKSDFTGDPKFIGSALYVSKVTPNGVVYDKDKDGNRIPIYIGRGYDALVHQELYRDLGGLANEKQDAASARPTKGSGSEEDQLLREGKITWYQFASNSAFGSKYIEDAGTFLIPEISTSDLLMVGDMTPEESAKYTDENKDRSTLSILLENEKHVASRLKDSDKTGTKAFEVRKDYIDTDYNNASQLALPEDMTIDQMSSLFDFTPFQQEGSSSKDLLKLKGASTSRKGVVDVDRFGGGASDGIIPYYSYVVSYECRAITALADKKAKKETDGYFVISSAGTPQLVGNENNSVTQQNKRAKEFLDFAISEGYFNRHTDNSKKGVIKETVRTAVSFNGKMQTKADRTGNAPVLFTFTTTMSKGEYDNLYKAFRKKYPDNSSNHDNAIGRYLDIHRDSNGNYVIKYNRVVSANGMQMEQINNISANEHHKQGNNTRNTASVLPLWNR